MSRLIPAVSLTVMIAACNGEQAPPQPRGAPDPAAALASAQAALPDPGALPALRTALAGDRHTRLVAVEALDAYCRHWYEETDAAAPVSPRASEDLVAAGRAALASADRDVCNIACMTIASTATLWRRLAAPADPVTQRLCELLDDRGEEAAPAARALAALGATDGLRARAEANPWALYGLAFAASDDRPGLVRRCLDWLAGHPDAYARARAIDALAALGTDAQVAIPTLLDLIDAPDKVVRKHAVSALGAIPPGSHAERVVTALARCLESPSIDDEAAEALGQLGPLAAAARPALRRLLQESESAGTRRAAQLALERIG